tara:strand:+ start:1947 stop:3236 length:1290 start_codon:yes stop_codon:yes gene_type:complete
MSIIYSEVQPSNVNSTQKVSYKKGNPIVSFLIGSQPHMLDAGSVRISGNIQFFKDSAGASATTADQLSIDEKLAIYSIFEKVTVTSQRSRQVIETVNHYGRFLSSYVPYVNSKADKFSHMNEMTLSLPNYEAQKRELVDFPSTLVGNSFCIAIPTGFLSSGNMVPLSTESLGGIEISLNLAPDSQVLYAQDGTTTGLEDAYYELSNLRLHSELVVPADPRSMLPSEGQLTYNAITSYFNVINSTNAVVNFNLGTSRTLGIFMNMCPSRYLNNMKFNSFSTTTPLNKDGSQAPINQIIFTKAGMRMPIAFNLDTNVKENASITTIDPQVVTFARSAITSGINLRSEISPVNSNREYNGSTSPLTADGGPMECIGVPFDTTGTGVGEDFSTAPFGIQMEVGLTTDSPNALFLFVHSRQTLVFGPQGLQVIQ